MWLYVFGLKVPYSTFLYLYRFSPSYTRSDTRHSNRWLLISKHADWLCTDQLTSRSGKLVGLEIGGTITDCITTINKMYQNNIQELHNLFYVDHNDTYVQLYLQLPTQGGFHCITTSAAICCCTHAATEINNIIEHLNQPNQSGVKELRHQLGHWD